MLRTLFFLIFFLPLLHAQEFNEQTYFSYTPEELALVARFEPFETITEESLEKWDHLLSEFMGNTREETSAIIRTYTYLHIAQREFALLSYQLNHAYKGSLDFISFRIIRYLHPTFFPTAFIRGDPFSLALTALVIRKFQDRIRREELKKAEVAYFLKNKHKGGGAYNIDFGKNILSWIPWKVPFFVTGTIAAPPSEARLTKEFEEVRKAHKNATLDQIKAAQYWADEDQIGGKNWFALTNAYLFSHNLSLSQLLNIRALIAMGIYDTLIVAFEAKYNFLNLPPYLADPTLKPYVTYYKQPSYPSAAAMVAEMVSSLMSHFFPQDQEQWKQLSDEASGWGVWAGTNYPSDITAGRKAGQEISKYLLTN